jgi:exodeoxyribonuclease VIII
MTDYYNIAALSASGINDWHQSVIHFWTNSPFNPNRKPSKPTEAMIFGAAAHCFILEPDAFEERFIVEPECDRRTKKGKEDYESFKANIGKRTPVKHADYELLQEMRREITSNGHKKYFGAWLEAGEVEKEIYWERNGLPCKAKLDILTPNGVIIDYKTVADASGDWIKNQAIPRGLHRQAAWYLEAASTLMEVKKFVFIFQEKGNPAIIRYIELASSLVFNIAQEQIEQAAADITKRLENNSWYDLEVLDAPAWYYRKISEMEGN